MQPLQQASPRISLLQLAALLSTERSSQYRDVQLCLGTTATEPCRSGSPSSTLFASSRSDLKLTDRKNITMIIASDTNSQTCWAHHGNIKDTKFN
eukprot:2300952-Amphidinium_carterae.2